jgi:hypothetical protein
MSSTYRASKRDQAIADDHLGQQLPCRFCGASTLVDDLERYGARCSACYDAHRAESNPAWWPNRPLTADERKAVVRKAMNGMRQIGAGGSDPKAWARALQRLELAHDGVLPNGSRMTAAQCDAWREALRHETSENLTETAQ